MRACVIVVVQPVIKIYLQLFNRQINLLPKSHLVKLVQNGFMEAFADAVSLRMTHLRFGVFNVIQRKIKLIVVRFWSATKDTTSLQRDHLGSGAITEQIQFIRNHRVLLDADLAELYGVSTKVLVQAVKRNLARFPSDFMFQLHENEWIFLRSQSVTSKAGSGSRRYAPYAFTEKGVAMLSSVLNSAQAIAVNIEIMRTFLRLRETIDSNKEFVIVTNLGTWSSMHQIC